MSQNLQRLESARLILGAISLSECVSATCQQCCVCFGLHTCLIHSALKQVLLYQRLCRISTMPKNSNCQLLRRYAGERMSNFTQCVFPRVRSKSAGCRGPRRLYSCRSSCPKTGSSLMWIHISKSQPPCKALHMKRRLSAALC